jgi:hypothetical protein
MGVDATQVSPDQGICDNRRMVGRQTGMLKNLSGVGFEGVPGDNDD